MITHRFSQYPHSSESFGRAKGGLQSCVFYRGGQCHSNATARYNTNDKWQNQEGARVGVGSPVVPPVPSNWMGFSVRSRRYRYTVWLPAPGGNDSHIDWGASRRGAASLSAMRFDGEETKRLFCCLSRACLGKSSKNRMLQQRSNGKAQKSEMVLQSCTTMARTPAQTSTQWIRPTLRTSSGE